MDNFKQESKKLEKSQDNPYKLSFIKEIKAEFDIDQESTRKKYSDFFYYFDGIVGTKTNQSQHPAGIIASPINLIDNYGSFIGEDGQYILPINMEEIHEIGLAKYDILGLKNVGIVEKTCEYIGIKPPLSHEINWNDMNVFNEILKSQIGVFQFEGDYSYKLLCDYIKLKLSQGKKPTVADFTLINACLRPSGESYRDSLIRGEFNKNPSKLIDDLLEDTQGFLVYQEQTILFLQQICGLSGSEADNVRRAIGRKQLDRLQKALPDILEGYCRISNQPRDVAEEEAKQFLQIIEDASSYQFGKNHATGYSLLGYILVYFRHYYLVEFCCAYLNCSESESDILDGTKLVINNGITMSSIKFRKSQSEFTPDAKNKTIYKGLGSIKDIGSDTGVKLYTLRDKKYSSFFNVLADIKNLSINSKQLDILIRLNYFSEFGHPHQLQSQVKIYADLSTLNEKFKTCKQLNKLDCILPIDEVAECCGKQTEKQFREIDNDKLLQVFRKNYPTILKQISAKYPYAQTTTIDLMQYEVELLGYTDIKDSSLPHDMYMVTKLETNNWGTCFVSLYQCNSGIQKTIKFGKVKKKPIYNNDLAQGNIVIVATDFKKKGRYDENHKWIESNEYEELIISYAKIK